MNVGAKFEVSVRIGYIPRRILTVEGRGNAPAFGSAHFPGN